MDERRRYGREIRGLQQRMESGQGDPNRIANRMNFLQRQQELQAQRNQPGLRATGQMPNYNAVAGQPAPMPNTLQQPGQASDLRYTGQGPMGKPGVMLDATRAGNQWQGIAPPNGQMTNNGLYGQPDGIFAAPHADQTWLGQGNPMAPGSNGLRGGPNGYYSPAADASMGQLPGQAQAAVGGMPGRMPMTPRPMPGMQQPGMTPQQLQQTFGPPPNYNNMMRSVGRPPAPQGLLTRPPQPRTIRAPDDRVNGPVQRY